MRSTKNYLRKLSFVLCLAFIIATISIYSKNVNATDVYDKPHFTVKIDSISPNPAKVGEDITVKGTITPQDFENTIQKKQIVLVIDVSGSMEGTKIANLKTAAQNFVTKVSAVSNSEIAIVAFSSQGIINPNLSGYSDSFVPLSGSNIENIKNSIQSLNANGATNTGEGLRKAAYLLNKYDNSASKTIVFMSDGEPTKYYNTMNWGFGTYTGDYVSDSSGDKYAWDGDNLPPGYNWKQDRYGYYYISDSSGNKYAALDWDNLPSGYYQKDNRYSSDYIYDSFGNKYACDGYNLNQSPYNFGHGIFTGYKCMFTYYTDITKSGMDSGITSGGSGYDDPDEMCLEYAKTIGQIIKDKGYNVFSIGYGLNDSGTTKMKAIHSSMIDNTNNYYATDTGAIDGVYNTIADKIINSYTLNNITLNLNLSADFTLNYGGNIVNIQNVTYSKRTDITDKIVYHAEPIPFQFTIKGSKQVTDYNILQRATLIVPWNGDQITDTFIPEAKITIIENNLPNIKVSLSKINDESYSPNKNPLVTPGQPIKVTYQITTDTFQYNLNNSLGGMIDDVVFVVDLSKDMTLDERWSIMKNEFTNVLLRGDILQDKNIKFGVVGYNDSVINPIESGEYNRLFNRNISSENEKLRLLFQEAPSNSREYIFPDSDKEDRNIGTALKKADQLLQEHASQNENKAIVLVNSGNVQYTEEDINAIKNKGYKIISLDMSCIKNQPVPTSNLHKLHLDLNGNEEDYFISTRDTNGAGNFNNDNIEMKQIANCLKGGINPKELIVSAAKLNFDLGENFEAVANSGLDGTGNIRTVTLPDIKYTLVKNDYGDYEWTQMNSNPMEVSFYVQVVPGKTGQLGFANDSDSNPSDSLKNYVAYTGFDGTSIKKHIDTPIVTTTGIPNINACLYSINGHLYSPNMIVDPSQPIGVKYQIYTDPFEYNSANSGLGTIDEAVFLIDLSHTANTANGARTQLMDPWFEKILINDEGSIFQSQNIKYGIVGYNGAEEYPQNGSEYNKLFNPEIEKGKDALISSISNINNVINKNNSSKINDIAYELEKADKLFTDGLENSRKVIVLVNAGDIDDSVLNSPIVNKIKIKGYKVISLNMNWSYGQQKKSNLPELHNALGGEESDYITSSRYNYGQGGSPESDMTEIAKRLNPGTSSTISISNVKLSFDLGENFNAVEDGDLEGTGKIWEITIPRIEYTLQKDLTSSKYLWYQTYPSQVFYKSFKVRVESGKSGQLGFGSYTNQDIKYSAISYRNFEDVPINKMIDTPLITVNQVNIEHGLYKGIQNGKPSIDKNERTFAKGSIVTMASSFDYLSSTTIKLELAQNIVKDGDIKIYKVNTDGGLIEIGTMTGNGSNYQAAIGSGLYSGDKILVLYNVRLPTIEGHYTNFIQVGDSSKIPAKLAVAGELPDLF